MSEPRSEHALPHARVFRARPVRIEAWQVGTDPLPEYIIDGTPLLYAFDEGYARLWVAKSKVWVTVPNGDYIVREMDGVGFYPCAAAIFDARWEATPSGRLGGSDV